MRLRLDECVPRPLKQELIGHDVWHVADMGWSSKRNSELLRLMAAERFDAFLTVDQNLAHFHPYELLPTREELLAWDEVVMEVVEATEKEWR